MVREAPSFDAQELQDRRDRARLYPGHWAHSEAPIHPSLQPLYRVTYRTREELQRAQELQPPNIRASFTKEVRSWISQLIMNRCFDIDTQRLCLDIDTIFDDPIAWLNAPHEYLGGLTPRECLGTENESYVSDIIAWIKYGIPS